MNFTELQAQVQDIVKRPDKAALIRQAINKACHRVALTNYFNNDLRELTWPVDPAGATTFSIPRSLLAQFRAPAYLKPTNASRFLRKIIPTEIFCTNGSVVDAYYITASDLVVSLSAPAPSILIAWYSFPDVLSDSVTTNWVTDLYPYAVIDGAAAQIFNSIGDDASYRQHEDEFRLACLTIQSDLTYGEA